LLFGFTIPDFAMQIFRKKIISVNLITLRIINL